MKNKIKIIILGIGILGLLLLAIFSADKKSDEEKLLETKLEAERNYTLEKIKSLPTGMERERISDETGAIYISPTKKEFDEIMAIREIKDKSPIETDYFKIQFNYGVNLIVVDFVDKENELNLDLFEEWKEENEYDQIDDKYWKVNL